MAAGRILARLSLLCTFRWSAKHLLQSYAYKCKVLYIVVHWVSTTLHCRTTRFNTNAQCSALMKRAIRIVLRCCTCYAVVELYSIMQCSAQVMQCRSRRRMEEPLLVKFNSAKKFFLPANPPPPSIVSMHTSFPEESFKSELFPQIYFDNKWDMLLIRGQGLQW